MASTVAKKPDKKNDFQSVVYLGIVMFGVMLLVGGMIAYYNLEWGISHHSSSLIVAGIILIIVGLILLGITDFQVLRNLLSNDWPYT